jgi:transposase
LSISAEYFGGAPRALLTDRMKSVLVRVEDGTPQWHSACSDFVASLGVTPRVCRPYRYRWRSKQRAAG